MALRGEQEEISASREFIQGLLDGADNAAPAAHALRRMLTTRRQGRSILPAPELLPPLLL